MSISVPGDAASRFSRDARIPVTSARTGTIAGVVGQTYTTDFAVASESVDGAAVAFGYDGDRLLTQAGELDRTLGAEFACPR